MPYVVFYPLVYAVIAIGRLLSVGPYPPPSAGPPVNLPVSPVAVVTAVPAVGYQQTVSQWESAK